MAIRMVRRPASTYTVYSGNNYYAEDDINLTTSLGTTEQSYPAVLFNLAYGKIIIDDVTYLVSTSDMVMNENVRNYNAVLNTDDFVGLRYAYGDQNGYVKGYGSEVSPTVDGTDFTINNGILVLRGVESKIDGNGETLHFNDGITSLRYVTIYYSVNTGTNTVGITSLASSTGYTQDLITSADGTVSMALYHFQLQNNEISNVVKLVKEIEYINKNTTIENANKVQNVDLSEDNASQFGDYIVPKKKLLWSGLLSVGSNGVIIQFPNAERLRGKTIEVVFRCMTGNWGYTHSIVTPLENTNMQAGLFGVNDYRFEIAVHTDEIRFYARNAEFRLKEIYEIIE